MTDEPTNSLAVDVTLEPSHEVLVFAHRQVLITGGTLMTRTAKGLEPTGTTLLGGKSPIAVTIDQKPRTFEKLVAHLEYRGLPPRFVRSAPLKKPHVAALTLDASGTPGTPGAPGATGAPVAPGRLSARDLDKRRLALVARLPGTARTFAEQFAHFDQLTDPTPAPGKSELSAVREILMNRVIRRGAWSKAGKPFPMPLAPTVRTPLRIVPELTHKRFRGGLNVFKTKNKKGFDVDHFHSAFAAFTCGELELQLSPEDKELRYCGVPDSAYFFCFAEAALWFHELGIEPLFWAKLLPLFVGATEVFKDRYFEAGEQKTRFAYARGTPSSRLASSALLKTIKAKYARMSVDDLAAKLGEFAADAFADEVGHLVVDSGDQPVKRTLTYELLHRRPAGANGTSEPRFDRATTPPQKALLERIADNDKDKLVRYHDDPALQDSELLDHVAAKLEDLVFPDKSNGSARNLKLALCDPKWSRYNSTTGACDPPGLGSSFRYRLSLDSKTPCEQGAEPDTELELIIATEPPMPTP